MEEFLNSSKSSQAVKLYINQKTHNVSHLSKIIRLAKEKQIPIVVANPNKLINISKHKNIQALLEISKFQYSTIEDIEKNKTSTEIILLVYKVKDPRNLGAILRTSSAFDIKGVIITSKDSCPINDTVIHTSRNTQILISRTNNALKTIEHLKQKGYKVFCLDTKGKFKLTEITKFQDKILLILGGEKGIDNKIKEISTTVNIPIKNVESLNTSVALGITLYHLSNLR
ncbi:MAG: RNA methyltransferase [Candidatus Calescibacterium sp.]|nr:RNA methyltransferase [Candidatus Calescibacterium sp.]